MVHINVSGPFCCFISFSTIIVALLSQNSFVGSFIENPRYYLMEDIFFRFSSRGCGHKYSLI